MAEGPYEDSHRDAAALVGTTTPPTKWKPMNIDRAVMVLAGILTLLGTTLAVFVSLWWLALPVFVGLNQLQASLTGFCPAATLLHKAGVKPGCAFR